MSAIGMPLPAAAQAADPVLMPARHGRQDAAPGGGAAFGGVLSDLTRKDAAASGSQLPPPPPKPWMPFAAEPRPGSADPEGRAEQADRAAADAAATQPALPLPLPILPANALPVPQAPASMQVRAESGQGAPGAPAQTRLAEPPAAAPVQRLEPLVGPAVPAPWPTSNAAPPAAGTPDRMPRAGSPEQRGPAPTERSSDGEPLAPATPNAGLAAAPAAPGRADARRDGERAAIPAAPPPAATTTSAAPVSPAPPQITAPASPPSERSPSRAKVAETPPDPRLQGRAEAEPPSPVAQQAETRLQSAASLAARGPVSADLSGAAPRTSPQRSAPAPHDRDAVAARASGPAHGSAGRTMAGAASPAPVAAPELREDRPVATERSTTDADRGLQRPAAVEVDAVAPAPGPPSSDPFAPMRQVVNAVVTSALDRAEGPAPAGSAAAVPHAALSARLPSTMTIELSPADLGTVSVRMQLTGDKLELHVSVEKPETLAMMDRDRDMLSKALNDRGYGLDALTIRGADQAAVPQSAASTPSGGDQGAARGQPGHLASNQGSARDGDAPAERNRDGTPSQQNRDRHETPRPRASGRDFYL